MDFPRLTTEPAIAHDSSVKARAAGNHDPGLLVSDWLKRGPGLAWNRGWFDCMAKALFAVRSGDVVAARRQASAAVGRATTTMERGYAHRLLSEVAMLEGADDIALQFAWRAHEALPTDRWVRQTLTRALAASGNDRLAAELADDLPLDANAQTAPV